MGTENKAVLISIKPKWCELIASGEKTIEVRKTKPKLKPQFKCYIYCTKPREKIFYHGEYYNDLLYKDFWSDELVCGCTMDAALNGKIIGEFVCDRIDTIDIIDDSTMTYIRVNQLSQYSDVRITAETCLNIDQLQHYLDDKEGYGWHISDLKIYDEPKELNELRTICRHYDDGRCGDCEYYDYANSESYSYEECAVDGFKPLKRPPQSWCYVEEG